MSVNEFEIFTSKSNCKEPLETFLVSKQLRRIKGKKQVFSMLGCENEVNYDYIHERLLHSLEVLSISKEILNGICQLPILIKKGEDLDSIYIIKNDDLLDCIALSHDFGHTPFGHVGETAISDFMKGINPHIVRRKNTKLIENGPLFKHNVYSAVLLTRDTSYFHHEIIDGVLKHSDINKLNDETINSHRFGLNIFLPHDLKINSLYLKNDFSYTLEGQIVALSDEIAQILSDIEDSYITSNDNFFSRNVNPDLQSFSKRKGENLKNYLKRLRYKFVNSAINETRESIKQMLITSKTYPDFLFLNQQVVKLCKIENDILSKIKIARVNFLHKKPIIIFQNCASYLIIYRVFDYFLNNPLQWFNKDHKASVFLVKNLITVLNSSKTKKISKMSKFELFKKNICERFEWGNNFIEDLESLIWPSDFIYSIGTSQKKKLINICKVMNFYYFQCYGLDRVMDSLCGALIREVGFTIAKMTDRFALSVFRQSFNKCLYKGMLLLYVNNSLKFPIKTKQFNVSKKDFLKVYSQILKLGI